MLYFPQLASGATVQYPFVKRRIQRTICNHLAGGDTLKLLDPGWAKAEWELTFENLNSEERTRLENFFASAGGRLNEFTFLDPTQNLLLQSEDLGASAWTKDPLLALTTGIEDPNGGTSATRLSNTGATGQRIHQTILAPGWFDYCFSLYAKGAPGGRVALFRSSASTEEARECALGPSWSRLALAGESQSDSESVAFGLSLAPGISADIYGVQAEAQPAPSTYRKTTSRCGVYRRARIDQDSLSMTSHGPEQHACTLRIVASLGS